MVGTRKTVFSTPFIVINICLFFQFVFDLRFFKFLAACSHLLKIDFTEESPVAIVIKVLLQSDFDIHLTVLLQLFSFGNCSI